MAEIPETVLDAALFVARELGAYVFPVDHPDLPKCVGMHGPDSPCDGKRGKHNEVKYTLKSTNNLREITAIFTGSTRNYGVYTRQSRLLVIDEDTASLTDYAASIGQTVPETFEVRTGRTDAPGRHLWFIAPDGVKLSNATGTLPKGIDVRAGSNGYVIGPGSKHQSGATYTATWDRKPVPAPQWLVDALTPPPAEPVDDVEDLDDAEDVQVPARVQAQLDRPVDDSTDKSERFHAIVGAAKAAGMRKAEATLLLLDWCEKHGKYKSRVPEQVTASWKKLPAPGERPAEDKPEPKSAATMLVEIAEAGYEFGISDAGETFAVPREGPKVVQLLRGGKTSLRAQLAKTFFAEHRKVAAQQALADALGVLEGMAQEDQEQTLALAWVMPTARSGSTSATRPAAR